MPKKMILLIHHFTKNKNELISCIKNVNSKQIFYR